MWLDLMRTVVGGQESILKIYRGLGKGARKEGEQSPIALLPVNVRE
jgi:hypothetical protein